MPSEELDLNEPAMWTLVEAVPYARRLESVLIPRQLHCALGGSVLHRGGSTHDLDLFIYPHTTEEPPARDEVELAIQKFAPNLQLSTGTHYMADQKFIGHAIVDGKRIDFFYLEMQTVKAPTPKKES